MYGIWLYRLYKKLKKHTDCDALWIYKYYIYPMPPILSKHTDSNSATSISGRISPYDRHERNRPRNFVPSIELSDAERYIIDTIMAKLDELSRAMKSINTIELALVYNTGQQNQYVVQPESLKNDNTNTNDELDWDKTQRYIIKCQTELTRLYRKVDSLYSFFSNFSTTSVEITKTAISGLSKIVTAAREKMAYIESRIAEIDAEMRCACACATCGLTESKMAELTQQKEMLRQDFIPIKLTSAFFAKSALALCISELDADILGYEKSNRADAYADRFSYADYKTGGLFVS